MILSPVLRSHTSDGIRRCCTRASGVDARRFQRAAIGSHCRLHQQQQQSSGHCPCSRVLHVFISGFLTAHAPPPSRLCVDSRLYAIAHTVSTVSSSLAPGKYRSPNPLRRAFAHVYDPSVDPPWPIEMTQPDTPADATGGTLKALEALQNQTPHNRRPRPPDLLPTKPEKLNKRESRVGLRGLFSRSRSAKDVDSPQQSPRDSPRGGGIRTSWADLGGWSLQHQRSEGALPPISDAGSVETTSTNQTRQKKALAPGKKTTATKGNSGKANWDPPPLFQAYPQALRHAHLPACMYSADAILRITEKRSAREDAAQEALHDDDGGDRSVEKKKRHRRNSLSHIEWTTKVYVLVTSGYLLQYSGEGSFNRQPEKVLHLGKDSAAFASDAIPGRHWVLRVAETMEPSSSLTDSRDSRSLFSRIPFRAAERRHASNFLMVFDGAEDMDGWISVLRKEIEALGGKKNLSETGKPKTEDDELQLKAQVSQRTLVVRDPERFSRSINPQDITWQHRQSMSQDTVEARSPVTVVESETTPEHSPDDISTTNSVISHDGRQLENLRDSAGANRLSYISSGQRTIITSAGSSPACSPIRDSFASNVDDLSLRELAPAPEARPRPNAAAIADRRQSMQAMGPFIDPKLASSHRPHSTTYVSSPVDDATAQYGPTTPNFSVPHAVSRRYSLAKPPDAAGPATSPPLVAAEQLGQPAHPPRASTRRCPPAGLGMSRPLSIVADQPSPIPEVEPSTREAEDRSHLDPAITVNLSRPPPQVYVENNLPQDTLPREARVTSGDFGHLTDGGVYNPRKATSMHALRHSCELAAEEHSAGISTNIKDARRVIFAPPRDQTPVRRCTSSMGHYERSRSQSPSAKQLKRASLQPAKSTPPAEKRSPRFSLPGGSDMSSVRASTFALFESRPPSQHALSPPATRPQHSASGQFLGVGEQSKALFNRRSMPHLAEGPPPAPPPTCALPPIPQKIHVKS